MIFAMFLKNAFENFDRLKNLISIPQLMSNQKMICQELHSKLKENIATAAVVMAISILTKKEISFGLEPFRYNVDFYVLQ